MMRVGLISNPLSQRNRQRQPAMREAVGGHPDLLHAELDSVHATADVLRDFARREVGLIIVCGGDGTVQKVLTELLNGREFDPLPAVAVLPGGMTNLIAADVGLQGDPVQSLVKLCRLAADPTAARETPERAVLSLQRIPGEPPIHGMFLGTAAFYHAVMMARHQVHPTGAKRDLALGMGLALALFRLLTGWRGSSVLSQGERMTVELDGRSAQPQDYLLFLVTTLERLMLGLMPFWGEGSGGVRYTSVGFPPQRLWRALLPVIRGRPRPWMAARGYESGLTGECRLSLKCPIVFDGEIFTPEPGTPVTLRADRRVTFLRC
ncbi:MAG TPA: acylglycerol kinase family protein [Candidatus Angelobacter sp.]|nr:acylglycerol kinase family protein [Candidatus Angelobacter sp.]